MLDLIMKILGTTHLPARVISTRDDSLYEASATRGTLVIGDPSMGKTEYTAMQVYRQWRQHHNKAVFVFDWSGPITNSLLRLISREPNHEKILEKVILNELGNEEIIIPKPEFHADYGLTDEEQVQRVVENFDRLGEFMSSAEFLRGVAVKEVGKNLFRLLQVIRNAYGENWQITEAIELLTSEAMLKKACDKFGQYAIPAKMYFEKQFLPKDSMSPHEKELTTRALRTLLGEIDSKICRATLGYHKPGYTEKEAIENGMLVLIDAHKMANLQTAQHYLLMQNFSQVMSYINKRETDNPNLNPVMIAFDETYTILKIPGMAEWLGMVSPLYRSRVIQLLIIIQALWQLDENFQKQVWTLGNIVSFAVSNADESQIIAKQLFKYDPKYVKNPPKTDFQNPTTENTMGQDRLIADWLQNLQSRQFVMRRYITEQKREKDILFVKKTTDLPTSPQLKSVAEIKKQLLKERGVPIRDALEVVTQRMK